MNQQLVLEVSSSILTHGLLATTKKLMQKYSDKEVVCILKAALKLTNTHSYAY